LNVALRKGPLASAFSNVGFYLGTREALWENDRQSISLTIDWVDAFHIGMLIALFERAVGLYAFLININAYHQPGVEAGKRRTAAILCLQVLAIDYLAKHDSQAFSAEEIAVAVGRRGEAETIFRIFQHLAANQQVAFDKWNGLATRFRAVV